MAGSKKAVSPVILMLSNAPEQRDGPCWMEYERAGKMLRGQLPWDNDDDMLVCIYEVDEDLGDAAQEKGKGGGFTAKAKSYWPMSIPSLGKGAATYAYANRELRLAFSAEGDADAPRRILGLVPHASDLKGWFKWKEWERCLVPEPPAGLDRGTTPLFLSLDLGAVIAFSSLGLCWRLGERLYCEQEAYTHEHDLAERGEIATAPFRTWAREGWIKLNKGRKTDWTAIARRIKDLADTENVCGLALDPWNKHNFCELLDAEGVRWKPGKARDCVPGAGLIIVDHPQGGKLKPRPQLCQKNSMWDIAQRVHADPPTIMLQDNHLTNWMLACTSVKEIGAGSNLNRYLEIPAWERQKGRKFNDSLIALVMGVGLADYELHGKKAQPDRFLEAMDWLAKRGHR